MTIGIRLVRGHDGDDYVAIAATIERGDDGVYHGELERGKARTDRQMRRAVTKYAKQLRVTTG